MTGFAQSGLGDDTGAPDLSFLGGSALTAFAVGIGVIVLFKAFDISPRVRKSRRSSSSKEYAAYMAKKHKLSADDRRWLEENA